jgi:hypothetical protein
MENHSEKNNKGKAFIKMTFCPTLAQRLKGKKNIVLRQEIDASKLQ